VQICWLSGVCPMAGFFAIHGFVTGRKRRAAPSSDAASRIVSRGGDHSPSGRAS
jgi:hypothetical protein